MTPLSYLYSIRRSYAASTRARSSGALGMEFDKFGRQLGMRLLFTDTRTALGLLITPVSIVRYFEFPFTRDCISETKTALCLDVSSPRLFSFYASRYHLVSKIDMINPDIRDIIISRRILRCLGFRGITIRCSNIETYGDSRKYDYVWSLSVIEHIPGSEGDIRAVKKMYSLLRSGGRLILTIPVDRKYYIEYRHDDVYGLANEKTSNGTRFFQRIYDEASIRSRIIEAIGKEPTIIRWYGEITKGFYANYENRWMNKGFAETACDSWTAATNFQEYSNWSDMPGMGVCGLAFDKNV